MLQPVGSTTKVLTLPTTVVFTDQVANSIGVLVSEEDLEQVCNNAVNNALAGNVYPEGPDLYEYPIPAKGVSVVYQFRQDFSRLYVVAVVTSVQSKIAVGSARSAASMAVAKQAKELKKLKVGVHPRDFLKWIVKLFFRRPGD